MIVHNIFKIVCPENFVAKNGHCYGFETQSLKRSGARQKCLGIKDGYDLVVINDSEENEFLVEQIRSRFNGQQFWINLRESEDKKSYIWTDGTNFEFGSSLNIDPWESSNPNEVYLYRFEIYFLSFAHVTLHHSMTFIYSILAWWTEKGVCALRPINEMG